MELEKFLKKLPLPLRSIAKIVINKLPSDKQEGIIKALDSITEQDYISLLKVFHKVREEWKGVYSNPQKIIIIGPVNSGKSTLFNKLINLDLAEISPIPGTTNKLQNESLGLFDILDTPGANEAAGQEREQIALTAAEKADLIILLFDNTFRQDSVELYNKIQKLNKPYVVCLNKIDLFKDKEELELFLEHIKNSLNIDYIYPISALKGNKFNRLIQAIISINPQAMIEIASQIPKFRTETAQTFIFSASITAAAIGLTPLPIADIIPLSALQAGLVLKLARIYGYEIDLKRARELIPMFAGGFGIREAARQLLKLIPGFGWLVSSSMAASGTYAMGLAAAKFFETEQNMDKEILQKLFNETFSKMKHFFLKNLRKLKKEKKLPILSNTKRETVIREELAPPEEIT